MIWQAGQLPCQLADQVIHVWQVDLDRSADQFALLNHHEQARANKMPIARYRQRFINARGILRYLLANYLSAAAQTIILTSAAHGKLSLSTTPYLKFNLAHSKNKAIYVFNTHNEIGVDLEIKKTIQDINGIAARIFSPIECQYLSNTSTLATTEEKFFILWTRKEAIIKATGEGLTAAVWQITTTLADGQINPDIDHVKSLQLQLLDLPPIKNAHAALAAQLHNKELHYFKL